MVMYGATLPSYKSRASGKGGDKKSESQKAIKVDDINNREKIKQVLNQFN